MQIICLSKLSINIWRKLYERSLTNLSICLKDVAVKEILNIESKILSYIFDDVFKSLIKLIKIEDILIDMVPDSDDW